MSDNVIAMLNPCCVKVLQFWHVLTIFLGNWMNFVWSGIRSNWVFLFVFFWYVEDTLHNWFVENTLHIFDSRRLVDYLRCWSHHLWFSNWRMFLRGQSKRLFAAFIHHMIFILINFWLIRSEWGKKDLIYGFLFLLFVLHFHIDFVNLKRSYSLLSSLINFDFLLSLIREAEFTFALNRLSVNWNCALNHVENTLVDARLQKLCVQKIWSMKFSVFNIFGNKVIDLV